MKKSFLIALMAVAMLAFSGCSKQNDAEKLIKKYMFENLHDFKSYEVVDMGKLKPLTFENTERYKELKTNIALYEKISNAGKYDEIWKLADVEYDYQKDQWRQFARDSIGGLKNDMVKYLVEYAANGDSITGYKMHHKFRSGTVGGGSKLSTYEFRFDIKLKEIIDVITEE